MPQNSSNCTKPVEIAASRKVDENNEINLQQFFLFLIDDDNADVQVNEIVPVEGNEVLQNEQDGEELFEAVPIADQFLAEAVNEELYYYEDPTAGNPPDEYVSNEGSSSDNRYSSRQSQQSESVIDDGNYVRTYPDDPQSRIYSVFNFPDGSWLPVYSLCCGITLRSLLHILSGPGNFSFIQRFHAAGTSQHKKFTTLPNLNSVSHPNASDQSPAQPDAVHQTPAQPDAAHQTPAPPDAAHRTPAPPDAAHRTPAHQTPADTNPTDRIPAHSYFTDRTPTYNNASPYAVYIFPNGLAIVAFSRCCASIVMDVLNVLLGQDNLFYVSSSITYPSVQKNKMLTHVDKRTESLSGAPMGSAEAEDLTELPSYACAHFKSRPHPGDQTGSNPDCINRTESISNSNNQNQLKSEIQAESDSASSHHHVSHLESSGQPESNSELMKQTAESHSDGNMTGVQSDSSDSAERVTLLRQVVMTSGAAENMRLRTEESKLFGYFPFATDQFHYYWVSLNRNTYFPFINREYIMHECVSGVYPDVTNRIGVYSGARYKICPNRIAYNYTCPFSVDQIGAHDQISVCTESSTQTGVYPCDTNLTSAHPNAAIQINLHPEATNHPETGPASHDVGASPTKIPTVVVNDIIISPSATDHITAHLRSPVPNFAPASEGAAVVPHEAMCSKTNKLCRSYERRQNEHSSQGQEGSTCKWPRVRVTASLEEKGNVLLEVSVMADESTIVHSLHQRLTVNWKSTGSEPSASGFEPVADNSVDAVAAVISVSPYKTFWQTKAIEPNWEFQKRFEDLPKILFDGMDVSTVLGIVYIPAPGEDLFVIVIIYLPKFATSVKISYYMFKNELVGKMCTHSLCACFDFIKEFELGLRAPILQIETMYECGERNIF